MNFLQLASQKLGNPCCCADTTIISSRAMGTNRHLVANLIAARYPIGHPVQYRYIKKWGWCSESFQIKCAYVSRNVHINKWYETKRAFVSIVLYAQLSCPNAVSIHPSECIRLIQIINYYMPNVIVCSSWRSRLIYVVTSQRWDC